MLAKDKFSEKNKIFFSLFLFFFLTNTSFAISTIDKVKEDLTGYNNNLENSSMYFIQTDKKTLEEGILFIGKNRIKVEYNKPKEITLVFSKRKGMYVNHELREVEYFLTNKSLVKVFFKILAGSDFFDDSKITLLENAIILQNNIVLDEMNYLIEVSYENKPVKIRKIKLQGRDYFLEIGFFNHLEQLFLEKNFFSMADPFLVN